MGGQLILKSCTMWGNTPQILVFLLLCPKFIEIPVRTMFSFSLFLYQNKSLFYFTWIDKSSATLRETSGYELLGI